MRTTTAAAILVLASAGDLVPYGVAEVATGEPVAIGPLIAVAEADREQVRLVRWAASRFDRAGLDEPEVEVHFHSNAAGCGGHLGYARLGRVDVCTVLVNEMARRNLLHEMSHIWTDQNVTDSVRERFLEMRHLRSWNASGDPWGERGYEQAAEVLAWGLGNRILSPTIPDKDPVLIAAAYELLTGRSIPGVL